MLNDERHVACEQAQAGLLDDDSQFISITPGDIEPTAWGHPRPSETAPIRKTVQLIHYFTWNNKTIVAPNHYFFKDIIIFKILFQLQFIFNIVLC